MPGHDFFLSRELAKAPSGSFRRDPTPSEQRQQQQQSIDDRRSAYQNMADQGIRSLSGATTRDDQGIRARNIQREAGQQFAESTGGTAFQPISDMVDKPNVPAEGRETITPAKTTGIDTILTSAFDRLTGGNFNIPGVLGAFQNIMKGVRPTADSFKDKNFLATLENEFRKGNFNRDEYYDTYKDLIDEVFDVGLGGMSAEEMFNTQTVGAFNEAVAGDLGSDIQQRVDPIGFGRELLDRGGPQTSGQAEEFAKIDLSQLTNSPEDRRLAAAVMEARALAADKQSRQDANMGIMAASPALPGLIRNLPPDTPVIGGPADPPNPVLTPVPVGGVAPTTTGITPFNINQFYASLPQYTQQGIMAPINLSRFTDALRMFPGATV